MHRLTLLPLLALLLLPLGACDETTPPITPCETNADCAGEERCLAGFCAPGSARACAEDVDCPVDWICADAGYCRAAPPRDTRSGCTGAADCPALDVCIGAVCQVRECRGDEECPVDSLCIGTLCRRAALCTADDSCPGGACGREGRCIAGCTTNTDCGGSAETLCEDAVCLRACASDGACRPGQRCVDGFCAVEECSGFSTDDCPEGQRCDGRGRCAVARPCDEAADCADTDRCVDGFCEAGDACSRDTECDFLQGAFCSEGRCAQARECSSVGAACLPTEACTGGFCFPGGCLSDADCLANQMCDAGRCHLAPTATAAASLALLPLSPWFWEDQADTSWIVVALDAEGLPLNPARLEPSLRLEGAPEGHEVTRVPGTNDRFVVRRTSNAEGSTDIPPSGPPADPLRLIASLGALDTERRIGWIPAAPDESSLRVQVVDASSTLPIPDATLHFADETHTLDADGGAWLQPEGRRSSLIEVRADGYRSLLLFPPSQTDSKRLLIPLRPLQGDPTRVRSEHIEEHAGSHASFHGLLHPRDVSDFDLPGLLGPAERIDADLSTLGDPILSLPTHLLLQIDFLGIGTLRRESIQTASGPPRALWSLGSTPLPEALFALFANDEERDFPVVLAAALPLLTGQSFALLSPDAFDEDRTPSTALTQPEPRPHVRRIVELPTDLDRERAMLVHILDHPWTGPLPLAIGNVPPSGAALLLQATPEGGLQRSPQSLLLLEPDPGEGRFGAEEVREGAGTAVRRILAPASRTLLDLRGVSAPPRLALEGDELLVVGGDDTLAEGRLIRIEGVRDGRATDLYLWGQSPDARRVPLTPFAFEEIDTLRLWEFPSDLLDGLRSGREGALSHPSRSASRWFVLRTER